jgi:cytosine/uracil/thiamine/allantoin permease
MIEDEIVEINEDVSQSPLYSEDLAPVPRNKRTWSTWNLAAIWVGMAVCIPTYMLASYMMKSGMSWQAALLIIALANLVITVPMALNGHAGVRYGVPFPVLGRAAFGVNGIHLASITRALVACGWFGVQTWIGGLALYAIWNVSMGYEPSMELDTGQFVCFGIFWFVNMFFIWKGTESIKWLEEYSAPILIIMGVLLIVWGAMNAGGFGSALDQSTQLQKPTAVLTQVGGDTLQLQMNPIRDLEGTIKADEYLLINPNVNDSTWKPFENPTGLVTLTDYTWYKTVGHGDTQLSLQFREGQEGSYTYSSTVAVPLSSGGEDDFGGTIWGYIMWFTAMVGFWATMAISIPDITRYTSSQKSQVRGQFIGLPGTMILYSFVGIFVTCAAVVAFDDVLIADDAPWDPVSLLAKFDEPWVVIVAQIFMLIATLSTNIAANVIAPANAFSNLAPKKLSFKAGGTIAGIIGILICPWWLMNEISGFLIMVSAVLGPVLGILLCDYFVIRKKRLQLAELYKLHGAYSYGGSGVNQAALLSFVVGAMFAIGGYWIEYLEHLYSLSWFTGFIIAFVLYFILMAKQLGKEPPLPSNKKVDAELSSNVSQ